jgi:hypothetical protein
MTGTNMNSSAAEFAAAPKKDRIKGSKTNKKDSAKSEKSAKTVKFSARVTTALTNKVKEHNKKAPSGRKTTLAQLKAVYRRGAGAYSTSHRPGKTRDQWAMARVNAYLKLLRSGRPSNPNYKQDNDLLPSSHPRSSRKRGTTAGGGPVEPHYTPAEIDLARSLVGLADRYGKFDLEENGIWVGYVSEAENADKEIGVHCHNCMLYQGNNRCAILSFEIEDYAKCRFAILPAGAVTAKNPTQMDIDEVADILADSDYVGSQLIVELEPNIVVEDPELALLNLAEFSGLGYEALPALRAAWLRGVEENDDGYTRAKDLAVQLLNSCDADLLPKELT